MAKTAIKTEKNKLLVIFLLAGIFLLSFCVIHVVHKHCPLKAEALGDYDAACQWVKTDKAGKSSVSFPSFFLFLYILSIAGIRLFPVTRLPETECRCRTIYLSFPRSPRSPPYSLLW